ncbi:spermatogenesis-defective protein 39 homolog [Diachasmimorpha longicaudata]|uniref:spermatogenesis-defective protein 39 homolog n=1 Tax=Diachasmimorpha longicaudata TaxID=58733 RepID=UPI0030B87A39
MSKNDPSKDDEEYWNSSEKHSFSFDQNTEIDNLFGISKSGTAQLKAGISNIEVSDNYFKFDNIPSDTRPLLSVISEATLTTILEADKVYLPEESPVVDPTITLRRILLGQPFSLEKYKSLSNKTALLDAAISSGNGDAILIIILFITKTLKPALVQRLLMERSDAVNIYVHYLSTRLMMNEITDLLAMQGRPIDAAMTNLNVIIKNTRDEARLIQKLNKCYKTQFMNSPECRETPFVQNYIKLLEWKTALKNTKLLEDFKPNSSVLDCLRYSCREHYGASDGTLVAPAMLDHQHEISPRQYQKVALEARVGVKAWEDVDGLLLSKGWLGSHKLQTNLPIEDVLKILNKGEAPTAVLDKFLRYVDSVERRLHLAKFFSCPKTVIEILGTQGDRTSLLEYRDTLVPQSEAFFLAERTLSSPTIRWKS